MPNDAGMGGTGSRFPTTRGSVIDGARSEDPGERAGAFDLLVAAYWKPVYKYVRTRWRRSDEDAEDLTQEFFTRTFEKGFLESYDAERARLRTFLRTCVDRLVQNRDRDAKRIKRGGGERMLSLDFQEAESELKQAEPPDPATPADSFEREWMRSLFSMAVEGLQADCESAGKATHFKLFERYDLDDSGERRPTYADLAEEYGLAVTDVTNYLAFARREFRRHVLERLRRMTGSEREYRREARCLLGITPE